MIYKFQSKAAGDVIMLGPSGDQVLQVLGREPAPKGILEVAALPQAITALERAVADDDAARKGRPARTDEAAEDGAPRGVSLRQRAWPLVEMMKRAHAEGEPIVWGV